MQITVRFCTSAKQDDVELLSPAQLALNEQSSPTIDACQVAVIGLPTAMGGERRGIQP
jgi:hypothetical protein